MAKYFFAFSLINITDTWNFPIKVLIQDVSLRIEHSSRLFTLYYSIKLTSLYLFSKKKKQNVYLQNFKLGLPRYFQSSSFCSFITIILTFKDAAISETKRDEELHECHLRMN